MTEAFLEVLLCEIYVRQVWTFNTVNGLLWKKIKGAMLESLVSFIIAVVFMLWLLLQLILRSCYNYVLDWFAWFS